MTDNQEQQYASYVKKAWIIYNLIAIALATIMVLFVARDNEEMFFYGLLTPAAFYVFRPTDRSINKFILKFTGVSPPKEEE